MRAVVSRVTSANVTVSRDAVGPPSTARSERSGSVGSTVVGAIDEPGLLVLVGVTHADTPLTARTMASKLHQLRILRDEQSCASTGAPLLVVSQFTLYGRTGKGRRPSWSDAAPAALAAPLVAELIAELRRRGARVHTGVFGARMAVTSTNDGPFTVLVDV